MDEKFGFILIIAVSDLVGPCKTYVAIMRTFLNDLLLHRS